MIMYYDGSTTTVNSSGYLAKNLADIQFPIAYIMRTYNNNRPITKPTIDGIAYDGETQHIQICMSDSSIYILPFYGITAGELWNSGEKVISYLADTMGIRGGDNE